MLKNILIKTAELINRDDLINELKNDTPDSNSTNNDISRLISYYNYIAENICQNYFNLTHTQTIKSNKERQINIINFDYTPTKINSVLKDNRPVYFGEFSKFITVPETNTLYTITYKYSPEIINDLNQKVALPRSISDKIICYGIASEFLASKNQFKESEFWNNKFMFEIFKSKTTQDRKIKKIFQL